MRDSLGAVRRRAGWAVRDRFPSRPVIREIYGVPMVLPWSHRLPDYTSGDSVYGLNLLELAEVLATGDDSLTVLDVGANVGDSALPILSRVDARVLCVEGDPAYLPFLRENVHAEPRATVVEALLATQPGSGGQRAVREGGTTRFEEGGGEEAFATVTAAELRATYPEFDSLRLAKSDTDGYDVVLVPVIADAWHDSRPVLFFEYDHELSRIAGHDPLQVWPRLAELGYEQVAVWDFGGRPLGRTTVDRVAEHAQVLEGAGRRKARVYWDVAVVHADDDAGNESLKRLVPGEL